MAYHHEICREVCYLVLSHYYLPEKHFGEWSFLNNYYYYYLHYKIISERMHELHP
jgi:hypothetical protein